MKGPQKSRGHAEHPKYVDFVADPRFEAIYRDVAASIENPEDKLDPFHDFLIEVDEKLDYSTSLMNLYSHITHDEYKKHYAEIERRSIARLVSIRFMDVRFPDAAKHMKGRV